MKYKLKRVVFPIKTNLNDLENIIKGVSLNIAFEFGVDKTANMGNFY